MRGHKITDSFYQFVLVRADLTRPQQEAVEHILEQKPPPSDALNQLKAELIRLHGKSEWKWVGELFALPLLGGQRPSELLAQMKGLRPKEVDLWFRWQFFSRLPAWVQCQLAEDGGTVEQLAARVEDLFQKAPQADTIPAAPTEANAAPTAPNPKKQWHKSKPGDRKRLRSGTRPCPATIPACGRETNSPGVAQHHCGGIATEPVRVTSSDTTFFYSLSVSFVTTLSKHLENTIEISDCVTACGSELLRGQVAVN